LPSRIWTFEQLPVDTPQQYSDLFDYLVGQHLIVNGNTLDNVVREKFEIICERFNFRKDERDRTKIIYTPAEIVGVVKLFSSRFQVPLHMQMAAEGKAFWTDAKLKKIGLYLPSKRHAMDAMRHLLQYVTFKMNDKYYLYALRAEFSSG